MEHRTKILICAVICGILLLLSGCGDPVPLYGSWSDNFGNSISFFNDGTFVTKINTAAGSKVFEGDYTILLNALTFSCTSESLTIVTEWDIRGNMLYLDWTLTNNDVIKLTLFKTAN